MRLGANSLAFILMPGAVQGAAGWGTTTSCARFCSKVSRQERLGHGMQALGVVVAPVIAPTLGLFLPRFSVKGVGARTQATLDHAQSISRNLNAAVTDALAPDSVGENGGSNLRNTLSILNRGTTNRAEDTEALKHNFFFRGFFKKRGFYNLEQVTPAEYLKACDRQKNRGWR